jgi:hypothetical protein
VKRTWRGYAPVRDGEVLTDGDGFPLVFAHPATARAFRPPDHAGCWPAGFRQPNRAVAVEVRVVPRGSRR